VLMLVNHEANARRIARVPLLEAEVLRLTEANAALAEELARMREALQEAIGELLCVRDYIGDASRGQLKYRGGSDISDMAGEDLVRIDTTIAASRAALSHTGMTGQREGV
jgi:hypothetical protein